MIEIYDKTNPLNSMNYEIENIFKSAITSKKIDITNSTITTSRLPLNISSISNSNQYYILFLFPRTSKLKFASESYGSIKKRTFRVDMFVVAQSDSLCYQLAGKVQNFVDDNENLLTAIGLKYPEIKNEFLKLSDTKIFNSASVTGNLSCVVSSLEGTIFI